MDRALQPSEFGKPVNVHLTRWDLIAFNLLLTPRLRTTWIVWTTVAVVVGLLQLLGSKSRLTSSELVASAIVAIITATVVLVVGLVTSLLFVLITSNAANGVLGEHLYSFQVDGLREQTSANDSLVKWGGARAAHRIGGFILISVAPALFHVLPRRCFASVDDYDAFWHMTQRLKG